MAGKPTCLCGECEKCKWRVYKREWMRTREARLTPEQREERNTAARRRYQERREEIIPKNAERARQRRREDPERMRAQAREASRRHREKYRARWLVAKAVKSGKLQPQPCEECGAEAEAHHEDYARPLDVIWLCRQHHRSRYH